MSGVLQILGAARRPLIALGAIALLAACGQKGALYLPTGEAAAGRATLPEALRPETLTPAPSSSAIQPTPAASAPPSGTANPVPRP